jgi:hypothetical protein
VERDPTLEALRQAKALARRTVRVGLPGAEEPTALAVPEEAWRFALAELTAQRVTGLAVASLDRGLLRLRPEQAEELRAAHRLAMAAVVRLERLLLSVVGALEEAGVLAVVLKGAALARSFYPAPWWRAYGDLDVLVPTRDWDRACSVLGDLGLRRLRPEPRPGFDLRFGKGATFEDEGGLQVDLHRTLAQGPFGLWIRADELFEGVRGFPLADRTLLRLDDTLSLLHVCVHASVGRSAPLLMPLRDVLQVAWSGQVDWDRLEAAARRWRLVGPVGLAFRLASEALEVAPPDPAARLAAATVGLVERRALRAYTSERAWRGGPAVAALWAIPGLRQKGAYLRALLAPSRQFLEARAESGGPGSRLGRLKVPIRWARQWARSVRRRDRARGAEGRRPG